MNIRGKQIHLLKDLVFKTEAAPDRFALTANEKRHFLRQFKELSPIDGKVYGSSVTNMMLQSALSQADLHKIWALADENTEGKLNAKGFCIACKIISLKVKDKNMIIPGKVPPLLLGSVADVEKLLKEA